MCCFSQQFRVLLADSSVTHQQPAHNGLHSASWIKHSVNSMHILRSFKSAILAASPDGWMMTSRIFSQSGPEKQRFLYDIGLRCRILHPSAFSERIYNPVRRLFEMEMTLAPAICLSSTCRGFGSWQLRRGVRDVYAPGVCALELSKLKQILLRRLYTLLYTRTSYKIKLTQWQNILKELLFTDCETQRNKDPTKNKQTIK